MPNQYQTLVNILDQIRKEAPPEYRRYHVLDSEVEKLNQARSRAFIHLFLQVKFGLLSFLDRERAITDGANDGGIDAYYIDEDTKRVCLIQSKFRTTDDNFSEKEISLDEILRMDIDRITNGEVVDENGNEYNGKIKQLQRDLSEVPDIGRYSYEVVILANLEQAKPSQLRRLTGGFTTSVFNYEKTYNELVFPVVSGTYYNASELCITLNVSNRSSSGARVSYTVDTDYKPCDISLVFVPTSEIGKILYKYKNSILKYNPRSYLELSNNTVNRDIAETITGRQTNEFALFNNGITMLSDGTSFNERVGVKDRAQAIVTNPQVINGGQTAYTLSRLFESVLKGELPKAIFDNKEVLVKIITFDIDPSDDPTQRLQLIEDISKATNQQTPVSEADRRSNDRIQIHMQQVIFKSYGYYYERKRGEFADGVHNNYIQRSQIVDREVFLRVCMACDFRVAQARRTSAKQIFKESNFNRTLNDLSRHPEYFFAYRCFLKLNQVERGFSKEHNNKYGVINYGQALRYGKYAVVAVCNHLSNDKALSTVDKLVDDMLSSWLDFETYAISQQTNRRYFTFNKDPETGKELQNLNFSGYYKGATLDNDLEKFFIEQDANIGS
ncbi:MAG: AIPR family protein [Anaerolineaceae bacterium]|nr:AIPR family protein [Anaerolineaceae bacterium]